MKSHGIPSIPNENDSLFSILFLSPVSAPIEKNPLVAPLPDITPKLLFSSYVLLNRVSN